MTQEQARDERGTSSVEMLAVLSVLLLITFTVVQGGMYYHARDIARSAAASCAESARTMSGNPAAGSAAARTFLAQFPNLERPTVSARAAATTVTCTVTGATPALVPLPLPAINQSVTMPKERLT